MDIFHVRKIIEPSIAQLAAGYTSDEDIKELQEIKILDLIWRRQFEKSSRVLKDKNKSLNLNDCNFCIYRERMSSDGKYQ